ncbi:hypothetical protein FB45DRAFT_902492 [Roridomyces roridus]|uniref:Uncharacterized protein n=1 Tax=Roridomyces roridus TaxID=1738132 RepID=A0AAD7FTF0_9AGAR|nr:hypothetical protein FB45DRAFT_902492 [Roridomyces roridus]
MQTLQAASVTQQNAAAAQAEASLQKLHLEAAQAEIARAQDVVRALEAQRDDAGACGCQSQGARSAAAGGEARGARQRGGTKGGIRDGLWARKDVQHQVHLQQLQQQAAIAVQSSARRESMPQQERESEPTQATRPPSQSQSRPPSHRRQSVESTRPPPATDEELPTTRSRAPSATSSRRVSAPPAPTSEVRDSGVVVDPVPTESTSREQTHRTSSASGHSFSHSIPDRHSTPANPPPQPQPQLQPQPQRRDSVASRASSSSHNIPPATTTPANRPPSTTGGSFRRSYASSTSSTQVNNRARNAAALISAMMPQHISIPPPRINVEDPGTPLRQQPLSMPVPAPAPAPIPFQVERVTQQQQQTVPPGRTGAQTPSSVSTSLRTLRLTSFPPTAVAGSEPGSATVGPGMGMGGGLRERELSVILEHAEGSPGESVLGNPNPSASPNAWATGSARYSDPRGMDEWRRGTDEEAPRNSLPPPSPLVTPGARLLSPFDVRPVPGGSNAHLQPQRSRESIRSTTSKSSDTVNITIEPPSRPTSIGLPPGPSYSHGPPTQGPPGSNFLSPDDAPAAPVVPEEDDDDDDDESDGSSHGTPGFVRAMGPLPAFAQGVTYPPGFVPMSAVTPAQPLPPVTQQPPTWAAPTLGGPATEDGPQGGLPLGFQPTTPRAPDATPLGFHQPPTSGFQRDPPRQGQPPQGGYQPFQRDPPRPVSGLDRQPQPPIDGHQMGFQPSLGYQPPTGGFQREPPRPSSRQGYEGQPSPGGGNMGFQPSIGFQPPPLSTDGQPPRGFQPTSSSQPPTRPASHQMSEASTWGEPPGRVGVPNSSWGAPVVPNFSNEPPRTNPYEVLPIPPPQTRPAPTWTAPPVIGANSMGSSNDPSRTFGGGYNFGQTATPRTPAAPLGFSVEHVSRPAVSMAHSPQPGRPQSLAPEPVSTYFAPTPGRATGLPLPPSVSASSPATTISGQRTAGLNAGTTPAAVREGDMHSSGSSGSSSSSLGLAQATAHNTYANMYATGGPVIPPSPAHSYRPM